MTEFHIHRLGGGGFVREGSVRSLDMDEAIDQSVAYVGRRGENARSVESPSYHVSVIVFDDGVEYQIVEDGYSPIPPE